MVKASCTSPKAGCSSSCHSRSSAPWRGSVASSSVYEVRRNRSLSMRSARGPAWPAFVPAFVLLVGCGFVWQTHSQRQMRLAAPLASIIPAVDGYSVVDLKIGDDERRVAGMSDYV